jgi:hypothetical protein
MEPLVNGSGIRKSDWEFVIRHDEDAQMQLFWCFVQLCARNSIEAIIPQSLQQNPATTS